MKEILQLQNDSDRGEECTVENSDPLWEFDASDEEDIEPISSTSSSFTGTTPQPQKFFSFFFYNIVTLMILLANYMCKLVH